MKTYAAEISTGIVTEIIVGDYVWANENLAGEWVDCTDNGELIAGIGYTYDAELDEFVAPELPIEE
jgi:hypothetical protein